jgi:calcineurin-like phosphoesterase family protein
MAGDIWVSSDFHFNHSNILKFTDSATGKLIRGDKFSSVEEMNEHMVEQHNKLVKPGDIFYTLGDVVMGDMDSFKKLWPRLNGRKRLIVGNHDDIKVLAAGGFFAKIQMWRMFPEFGLLLTHVPVHASTLRIFVEEGEYKEGDVGAVQKQFLNVFGHIHQNPAPEGSYRCVCMEQTNYAPVNIEELRIR